MGMLSIRSKEFDTEAEAEAWIEHYYQEYHPAGYGTTLRVQQEGDRFVAVGSRGSSAD